MKRGTFIALIILIGLNTQTIEAQLFDKIKNKINKKIEDKVDEKADEILNGKKKKKNGKVVSKKDSETTNEDKGDSKKISKVPSPDAKNSLELWNKYDFLVADHIFYFDDLISEDYGEFPTKWNLAFGNAEIARLGEDKIIQFKNSNTGTAIYPLINKKDYIEDYTTIEFDIYFDDIFLSNKFTGWEFGFHDISDETHLYGDDYVDGDGAKRNNRIDGGKIDLSFSNQNIEASMGGKYSGSISKNQLVSEYGSGWHHVSMSFNKDNFKFYLDEHKLINAPRIVFNPFKFYIYADVKYDAKMAIRNIKFAQGGGSISRQITTDGRFITNGILFDSGKSTLKPQSQGVIKKLTDMMIDNPEWKFTIIGHTDSDGDDTFNEVLSEKRAEAVKTVLVEKGIDAQRLQTKGKGEKEPLNSNSSSLDKANNRRVEFVKQ